MVNWNLNVPIPGIDPALNRGVRLAIAGPDP
jgi:hypothetical protein